MSTAETGDILNAIGQHVADILGKEPRSVFVYILAGDNWQEAAVFDDLGNQVIYHDPTHALFEDIGRLWDAADADKKWDMIHYDIRDGRFDVKYFYIDDLDPEAVSVDFRQMALAERYGEKPIIYPEIDEGWGYDLTEDDLNEQ